MEVLRSPSGRLEATFHPEAGMVGSSLRVDGAELLAQRDGLEGYVARGTTFGIPLLHPWANRLAGDGYGDVRLDPSRTPFNRDPDGLPIHGLYPACPYWRVSAVQGARLEATLDWAAHGELMAGFPFPHRLTMAVAAGDDGLEIATTLSATGDVAVPVSFGFHPYLAADPARARVRLPVRTHLALDDRGIPTGDASPIEPVEGRLGDLALDDLYADVEGPFVLEDRRRVEVRFLEGYPYAQVWAPPGLDLVCFEPMTAPTNALASGDGLRHVAPGGALTARFAIAA